MDSADHQSNVDLLVNAVIEFWSEMVAFEVCSAVRYLSCVVACDDNFLNLKIMSYFCSPSHNIMCGFTIVTPACVDLQ